MSTSWQYISRGSLGYSRGQLQSLEGYVFLLDPDGPYVDEARLYCMIGDILFRGGTISNSHKAPPSAGRGRTHYWVRLGEANQMARAKRLAGWCYIIESELMELIGAQDERYIRLAGEGQVRNGREATLSTALGEMLNLTASVVTKVIGKITAPSGAKPYETEEEEIDAVDNEI